MHIETNYLSDVEDFDNIDAPSAALHRGDDGLIPVESFSEVGLTQAGTFALLDEQVDEADMSG